MGIPNATRQAASNAVAALGNWVSVHQTSAGGGTTGANEPVGGSYVRKQCSWTPNGTGGNTGTEQTIPVPAGIYYEAGVFSASSGGTFVGSGPFPGGSIEIIGANGSIVVIPAINV
jgi:hypothetical protein